MVVEGLLVDSTCRTKCGIDLFDQSLVEIQRW